MTPRLALKTLLLAALLSPRTALSFAQVPCGTLLTTDTRLTEDLICPSHGLLIGAGGVTLDCDGHTLRGSGASSSDGVRISGFGGVTIRNCAILGFGTAIRAERAPDLRVADNLLKDSIGGIRCESCPSAAIEGNRLEGVFSQVGLTLSPDARILDNEMIRHAKGGSMTVRESPRVRLSGNRGGWGALLDRCDGAVFEANELAGNVTVSLFSTSGCWIAGNTLVRGDAEPSVGGSIQLRAAKDCSVVGNMISGFVPVLVSAEPGYLGTDAQGSADRNLIEGNDIHGSAYGILLFGGSENRIVRNAIEGASLGLGLLTLADPSIEIPVPADRNLVEGNSIRGGDFGVYTWDASATEFVANDVAGHGIGIVEGSLAPADRLPNRYSGNSISSNRLFGLVAWGSSPQLEKNELVGNGRAEEPLPPDLEPFLTLLGDARGGIALLPFDGMGNETMDDGQPDNDFLAAPTIGGAGRENDFRDNSGVDIYMLDSRAANARTLEQDNRFARGAAERVRQDWYGLIRVENENGDPISGIPLDVRDALGQLVHRPTSGGAGFAPLEADPDRPQGLAPGEEGGPAPPWPRFTEYVIDAKGRRLDHTPHRIRALTPAGSGPAHYSWDGLANDADGFRIESGRYQTASVRLRVAGFPALTTEGSAGRSGAASAPRSRHGRPRCGPSPCTPRRR